MTLTDAKNQLVSHFLTSHTFSVKDDTPSLKGPRSEGAEDKDPLSQEDKEAVYRVALEELAKLGMVALVKEGFYVLTQPITSYAQNVQISPIAALMVADLAETFVNGNDIDHTVNQLAITEHDILFVCKLCHELLNERDDEDRN